MMLTFGVFFSVFLLTDTGLSYLTNEAFGGIILCVIECESNAISNIQTTQQNQLQVFTRGAMTTAEISYCRAHCENEHLQLK